MDRITAIKVFISVAERGSFTEAADILNISRPMISRYINLLEQWFNARLIQRTTRSLSLTHAGEQALIKCREIMATLSELEQQNREQELRGEIRLTASISFVSSQLASALNDFLRLHPKLRVQLIAGEESLNLIDDRIDLAIRISNDPSPNLIARPLAKCRSMLVASPDYLQQQGVPQSPEQLSTHRCFAHNRVNRTTWRFEQNEQKLAYELDCPLVINDANALLKLALDGAGIAQLPRYLLAQDYFDKKQLQPLLEDWQLPSYTIYALYPSRQHLSPAVRALLDFLVERFAGRDW